MSTRTITGHILHPDNTAWVAGTVTFKLLSGAANLTDSLPPDTVTATTDASGNFSVVLWCDDTYPPRYGVTLPNADSFSFLLVSGASVTLAALQAAGTGTPPLVSDDHTQLATNTARFPAQLLYAGALNAADTVTTTVNTDGSITQVYAGLGITSITTFPANGSVVETFTGNLSRVKTTTVSGSIITETIV